MDDDEGRFCVILALSVMMAYSAPEFVLPVSVNFAMANVVVV